jgi:hypothetical protein
MSNYPVDNQTGVLINKALVHHFESELDPDSIFSGSVVLYETATDRVVDGTYSYDSTNKAITFVADTLLNPNTSYVWYFTGEDTPDASPLELADGSPLAKTVTIGFQTGDQKYKEQPTTPPVEYEYSVIDSGQTSEERASDTFKVVETSPSMYESSVDVMTPQVTITFSSPVMDGIDFSEYIKLEYVPVLNRNTYYKNSKFNPQSTPRIPGQVGPLIEAASFEMPQGQYELSEDKLTIIWKKTEDWNANAFVRVTISKELQNEDGEHLNRRQDEVFHFLTDLFPMFSTLEATLLPLSSVDGLVSEEVVLKYLLKHSLEAYKLGNKAFGLAAPHRAAIRYAECATLLSIIDNQVIADELNTGKSIKLADLDISYGIPRNKEAILPTLRGTAAECKDAATKELLMVADNYSFRVADRSIGRLPYDEYRNQIPSPGDLGYKLPFLKRRST